VVLAMIGTQLPAGVNAFGASPASVAIAACWVLGLLAVNRTRHGSAWMEDAAPDAEPGRSTARERHPVQDHPFSGKSTWLAHVERLYRGRVRWRVGENLAWGERYQGTPRSTVTTWMHSPDHRANILTAAFARIGIGVARGVPHERSLPGMTYTTEFGT
jgi:hypothetical protein